MDHIKRSIEQGNYAKAVQLLEEYFASNPGYTDTIAILEASAYFGLGDNQTALSCIEEGLRINPVNYELYFMLGMVYESLSQYNKAYLCYENALHHSKDNHDDYASMEEHFRRFTSETATIVPKASIILLNFNQLELTKSCIASIRKFCPASACEIIFIDNASLENPEQWLQSQPDIKYQINDKNLGFAGGCNVGIRMAEPGNDIFLLNNDTLLTENALFWLRMGLYEKDSIGASGAVSNYISNRQIIIGNFYTIDDCMSYGYAHNVPSEQALSYRMLLTGFAMLIKRSAFEKTGFLDERFFPGNYEDNDYCTRLILNGYQLVVCNNSFIFHVGQSSFSFLEKHSPSERYQNILELNRQCYIEKWHTDPVDSYSCRLESVNQIHAKDRQSSFNCLDIGCAFGATLLEIYSRYPHAGLYGIESDPFRAAFTSHFAAVVQSDIETMDVPFDLSFDYIILGNLLNHVLHPESLLKKLKPHISKNGVVIVSIPNILHYSSISKILAGSFSYSGPSAVIRTHLHFFTLCDSITLFQNSGYEIINLKKIYRKPDDGMSAMNNFLDQLSGISGVVEKEQFYVSHYIFKIKPLTAIE